MPRKIGEIKQTLVNFGDRHFHSRNALSCFYYESACPLSFDKVLPDYYGLGEVHPKGYFLEKDIRSVETISIEGKDAVKLHVGPLGRKVISGMHNAIAAYAKAGNNVIVDYILYDSQWFPELVKALEGIKVYYVGLQYPP